MSESFNQDSAFYGTSGYERRALDRYWTEPWITSVLLDQWGLPSKKVWEPAAGRGDIVSVLEDFGYETYASDINMSEYLGPDPCRVIDFLDSDNLSFVRNFIAKENIGSLITNPPYKDGLADRFVKKGVDIIRVCPNLEVVAFLLRSEFKHGKKRAALFDDIYYSGEIVLRRRPRWDWWYSEKPISAPRHNFSWFIWQRDTIGNNPIQLFQRVN